LSHIPLSAPPPSVWWRSLKCLASFFM
jgi:hypothetical protein